MRFIDATIECTGEDDLNKKLALLTKLYVNNAAKIYCCYTLICNTMISNNHAMNLLKLNRPTCAK